MWTDANSLSWSWRLWRRWYVVYWLVCMYWYVVYIIGCVRLHIRHAACHMVCNRGYTYYVRGVPLLDMPCSMGVWEVWIYPLHTNIYIVHHMMLYSSVQCMVHCYIRTPPYSIVLHLSSEVRVGARCRVVSALLCFGRRCETADRVLRLHGVARPTNILLLV